MRANNTPPRRPSRRGERQEAANGSDGLYQALRRRRVEEVQVARIHMERDTLSWRDLRARADPRRRAFRLRCLGDVGAGQPHVDELLVAQVLDDIHDSRDGGAVAALRAIQAEIFGADADTTDSKGDR